MDWADEIAAQLTDALMFNGGKDWSHITAALRKAKADGMREAADMCDVWQQNCVKQGKKAQFFAMGDEYRSRDNAIEKGTG